jgi:hypothetical protein
MKSSLLVRLRRNGATYLISTFILIVGIPIYQLLVLGPQGYGNSLNGLGHNASYLAWVGNHALAFLFYRLLLTLAFAFLLTLPFSLYRIIVAQELMAQQERDEEEIEEEVDGGEEVVEEPKEEGEEKESEDGLPVYAWRGKGFAVLAVWVGFAGIALYVLGSSISTTYLFLVSQGFQAQGNLPDGFTTLTGIFTIATNTAGIGLFALATLLFGAMIARGGRNLWPGIWVAFGYVALALTALLSGSAVGIANASGEGQAPLTSPAIFLLGLWVGWLGIMLIRLKAEE